MVFGKKNRIRTSLKNFFEVDYLSSKEFKELGVQESLIQTDSVSLNAITRTFENKDENQFWEFYNGSALRINSAEDSLDAEFLEFHKIFGKPDGKDVSYLFPLSQEEFEEFKPLIEKPIVNLPAEFPGTLYNVKNSKQVLVHWKNFHNGEFGLLENLDAIIGFDPELANYLENQSENKIIERGPNKIVVDVKIDNGRLINENEIVLTLSKYLNIDSNKLNYTLGSSKLIENSLIWNSENIDPYSIIPILTVYVGKIIDDKNEYKWIRDAEMIRIYNLDGYEFPVMLEVAELLIDSCYPDLSRIVKLLK